MGWRRCPVRRRVSALAGRLFAGAIDNMERPTCHGDPSCVGARILSLNDRGDDIAAHPVVVDFDARVLAAASRGITPRAIIRARKPAEDEPWIAAGS